MKNNFGAVSLVYKKFLCNPHITWIFWSKWSERLLLIKLYYKGILPWIVFMAGRGQQRLCTLWVLFLIVIRVIPKISGFKWAWYKNMWAFLKEKINQLDKTSWSIIGLSFQEHFEILKETFRLHAVYALSTGIPVKIQ